MRVLIYTADEMRCGHRLIWPAQALKAQGADIDWIQRDNPDHAPWEQGADVIVMQRPILRRFAEAIPRVQADGITVVVDIDDDFKALNPRNVAFLRTSPKATWHENPEGELVQFGGPDCNWHHLVECCRLADLVTVTTPALAARFAKHGRVRIIPNHVPKSYFDIPHPKHSTIQVGWTGAVATHPDDLQVTRGAIPRALHGTGARFVQVGPPEGVEANLGMSPGQIWATGYVDLDSYPYTMTQIDVGIVPLELTAFNQAKCLDAATLVPSRRGLIPIGDVDDSDELWHAGQWVSVEAVHHETATVGLRFTLKSGRTVSMTTDHRMLVNGRWTFAGDITVGDVMAGAAGGLTDGPPVVVPWPSDSRMGKLEDFEADRFLVASDGPRVALTERWGRFLGLFAGDGGCSGKTAVAIHCDGLDGDLIDLIMDDFEAFGFWPRTEAVRMYNGTVLRRRSVRVSNSHLARFLRSLGVIETERHRRIVTVPDVIMRSPSPVIAAYLAGLFEADGSTTGSGVELTTKHHAFALQVQALLNLFGIESTVRRKSFRYQYGTREATRLTLRRAAADVFAKEIGFLSERKRERLQRIVEKPHSNAYRPMLWVDEVTLIESCWLNPVDVQVAGSVFAAAGLVSHNSYLKLLEFAALGVAAVGSPTDDNLRLAKRTGQPIAAKPKDWERTVRKLIVDEPYRDDVAAKAREAVRGDTVEANADQWWDGWESARFRRNVHPGWTIGRAAKQQRKAAI